MVFLKNYPATWREEEIYNFVKAFGEIDSEKDDTGKPVVENGKTVRKIYCEMSAQPPFETYAKIVFVRTSEAKAAIHSINDTTIEGKKLHASEVIPIYDQKKEEQNTFLRRGVYVTDVPEDLIDPQELEELFNKYGKVTTARIIKKVTDKDSDGNPIYKSKGQAFILFET